jgi:hypothetical protein
MQAEAGKKQSRAADAKGQTHREITVRLTFPSIIHRSLIRRVEASTPGPGPIQITSLVISTFV